ncbi:transcriptional regulator GltC [Fusobacterium animalis ATCC 51191]|uniref:Transcriptional regulator GltC n=1 Tax=Fusobacterium animalis ATCC 51191 TaxID=997347 RepID=F9EN89_9FUSO|nr:transcriptional regulator GltC [Fusobacterium animalis ATCC 51191]
MDLRQLEYIVEIAEEKNITKAAKKLYITQSALNQTLLKLEKEIGEPLFERSKLNLYLTEIGKIYVEEAKKILEIKKKHMKKLMR